MEEASRVGGGRGGSVNVGVGNQGGCLWKSSAPCRKILELHPLGTLSQGMNELRLTFQIQLVRVPGLVAWGVSEGPAQPSDTGDSHQAMSLTPPRPAILGS